jgi:EAL domain-containing protein (putative c-di-GMP-specific phosphodiesterase class I)/CHASE2 domain-containing sensor protein
MTTVVATKRSRGSSPAIGWLRSLVRGRKVARTRDVSLPSARRRIALWAVAIGLLAGPLELMMPIDDSYRAIRAMVREHPSDQRTVVVYVDDQSLDELGVNDPLRSDDAKVLEELFRLGAKRVFFDRAYADAGNPEEDAMLVAAMKRHRGKVFIGATSLADDADWTLYPHPTFRDAAEILSISGWEGPLGLATAFPTSTTVKGVELPSLSAKIAGVDKPGVRYRVDYAIDYKSIPTARYIDILRGRSSASQFAGKDVVIAPSRRTSSDFHPIPFNIRVPGALLHVMGAETLKSRIPIDLGWLPALVPICVLVALQAGRRRPSNRQNSIAFAALVLVPFALDFAAISVDIMPAVLCLGIASVRYARLARDTYRGSTGLQNIAVLQRNSSDDQVDVIALKIRNFATISALLTADQVEQLLVKAQAMLQATDHSAEFAFDKDTFVWLAARLRQGDLDDHLRGLHALFSTSITVGAQAPDIASSIGVDTDYAAPLRERTENAIQSAEDAAHKGRIFVVAEPRMVEDRVWRLQILSELESAIRNEEVEVFFQPKFALNTGTIVGAEALIRWSHPTRGAIEPSQVIAIAEEHNRVDMITRFVLNRAIGQARRALAVDPDFKIAINISALDLRNPLFVGQVDTLLAAYRFPASNLVLEITETAPIENDDAIAAALDGLKRLGVKLSVDDFGIGHASLHYLRRIPADEVKIDRSFVTMMDSSLEDRALVRASIDMIHSLGRTAVAEGVENKAVVELLREMGCDAAQGYFFAKAMAMDDLLPRMGHRTIAA